MLAGNQEVLGQAFSVLGAEVSQETSLRLPLLLFRFASLNPPLKMSDKHYTTAPQKLLDSAVRWLASEYGLASLD